MSVKKCLTLAISWQSFGWRAAPDGRIMRPMNVTSYKCSESSDLSDLLAPAWSVDCLPACSSSSPFPFLFQESSKMATVECGLVCELWPISGAAHQTGVPARPSPCPVDLLGIVQYTADHRPSRVMEFPGQCGQGAAGLLQRPLLLCCWSWRTTTRKHLGQFGGPVQPYVVLVDFEQPNRHETTKGLVEILPSPGPPRARSAAKDKQN